MKTDDLPSLYSDQILTNLFLFFIIRTADLAQPSSISYLELYLFAIFFQLLFRIKCYMKVHSVTFNINEIIF